MLSEGVLEIRGCVRGCVRGGVGDLRVSLSEGV